jgi:chemotaxis protein MotB
MPRTAVSLLIATLASTACVTTSSRDQTVADLNRQHQEELAKQKAQDDARATELAKKVSDTEAQRKSLETTLAEAQKRADELNNLLEGSSADRAKLDKLLQASSAQLDELRKQKAAAEARAATYKSLTDRLRSMIDAGKLSVKIRKGRMLISMPNDVLFDSGSAVLKKAGQETLSQLAQALSALADRQFLVAGNTDDKPIRTARFPSNWELSTERAVVVTRYLIGKGMKPDQLGALGYGEFDPIAPNDTPDHRAQNRRIEIQLQPNLSELPAMEDLAVDSGQQR